jgi:hypothetical protein
MPSDGRTGSSDLMAAVTEVCEPVEMEATSTTVASSGDSETSNLIYDCAGKAGDLDR